MAFGTPMARKKTIRTQDDVREYPCYSIEDVADYIGVPLRTLRSWVSGYSRRTPSGIRKIPPIIPPADPKRNLLSFFNLVEAQVLASTRERHIGVRKLRRAVEFLREKEGQERPLLTCIFHTAGQHLFVQQLGRTSLKNPLNVSKYGQYAFKPILKKYLSRIERDVDTGLPTRIYPLKAGKPMKGKVISIYPFVAAGKPAIRRSGISAEVIWRRKKEGETSASLARDFRLKPGEIKAALQYFAA